LTIDELREQQRRNVRRSEIARDVCGVVGLGCLVLGAALLSVPWALIVGGAGLLGLSIWGAIRSEHGDQPATRNPQQR
jgi:hypothetical protein